MPSHDEYYELMRSNMDIYSTAGYTGSYIYWAEQVSTEIRKTIVQEGDTTDEVEGAKGQRYIDLKTGTEWECTVKGEVTRTETV